MVDKKKVDSEAISEDELLEKRIDEMMDIRGGKKSAPAVSISATNKKVPEIDIFKDPKTAPEVSGTLLEEIGAAPSEETIKTITIPADTDQAQLEEMSQPATEEPAKIPEITINDDIPEIDDSATDSAVDDIVANEADTVLAAEDAATQQSPVIGGSTGWKAKIGSIIRNKWTWVVIIALALFVFLVPTTRYTVLGAFIKKNVPITVLDSKTSTPVSSAVVSLSGTTAKTDAYGKVTIRAAVGSQTLTVEKQYYTKYSAKYLVGLKSHTGPKVDLVATGRQVPVTILNRITGKPVAGAEVKILNTSAKTDSKGVALIVLPTSLAAQPATVSAANYNQAKSNVTVTATKVPANTIALTPSGEVYFLSNLGGTLDVVKTNLDGTGRKTVLPGTGREDSSSTTLLASRDWRYLVLKARREGNLASLFLIDTKTDKITSFDNSNSQFNLIGWYGHNFIYDLVNNAAPQTQAGREQIKSYDAERQQLNQLDANQAEGSASSYAVQEFSNFYIVNGVVVYNTLWGSYDAGGVYDLSKKNASIRAVQPTNQNKKDYQTFPAAGVGFIQAVLYEPQSVYYSVYNSDTDKTSYYAYENQSVTTPNGITQNNFTRDYPTYLLSPSGNQTFWTELRDGKNTLFTGDSNASNKKQIATLSEYSPYGWFSDAYVLVSKNASELYIMPVSGPSAENKTPVKISDYYKPAQTFNGYGYGYGGL